jgi:hypothetical protein
MHHLFDAVAVEGALLITYLGSGEMTAYRKVEDPDDGDEGDAGGDTDLGMMLA